MRTITSLIDGQWAGGAGDSENINPSDLSAPVCLVAQASAQQAAQAVEAARRAQPGWAATGLAARAQILKDIGRGIVANSQQLAHTLASEQGKTLPEARGEVQRAADIFDYYAGEVFRLGGEMFPSIRAGVEVEISREPLGVVALITPWNFPIAIPAWKTAPALACGNAVVLKPSEFTPATAVMLAEIIRAAGVPDGVFNLVLGTGADVGQVLTGHPAVAGVSFTGSSATGRKIAASAVAGHKKLQMEMGGKNPLVVLDDADLEIALACALDGAFHATGQRCTASSRLIVTPGIHDRFVQELAQRVMALNVGHALDERSQIGPVSNGAQFDKDLSYIALARDEAQRVVGGAALQRAQRGYYLQPCLALDVSLDARIAREEVFGPLACVLRAQDYEHALAIANDTEYGLSAGICTQSLKHATHFRRHVQSGLAMVNMPTSGVDFHVPFGGRGASSYGSSEQGHYAREFFTSLKTSYIRP
ncbi:aldehyde dehydrogenase family protein [Bordetella bronchiseptica]|uniref:aldehyde dehydrogenase family protein n=1 Tax=Bordetella bronchiseptica TaxID=518 RepID=UPI0004614DA9|nr:aldehyde dehydrogenase family protein [Bordetella bronchiseptica]AWP79660.1 aldehyde dehydrogenase family protein [Bordetella bronchiseptica]AWP84474.1 aldehyde dehydrogenase family protein [Bordetella bronchiseptica]AWQ10040.1 aldehyde dehydrogenase family protein [Bordetella bronchiseptica]KDB62317.1 putative aldehyde dehydrogenase, thermostable [Bordetella bronchiseptica B18-5 (C3)]KDB64335.1 putative aldehyde dehydrogenase, thermostable [Bordetella bronchiseptica A1-7]